MKYLVHILFFIWSTEGAAEIPFAYSNHALGPVSSSTRIEYFTADTCAVCKEIDEKWIEKLRSVEAFRFVFRDLPPKERTALYAFCSSTDRYLAWRLGHEPGLESSRSIEDRSRFRDCIIGERALQLLEFNKQTFVELGFRGTPALKVVDSSGRLQLLEGLDSIDDFLGKLLGSANDGSD